MLLYRRDVMFGRACQKAMAEGPFGVNSVADL
jgi:hypothetical protein